MNEIKVEEATEIECLCEQILKQLFEIKIHISNERYFEGGVELGSLINSIFIRQFDEKRKHTKQREKQCDDVNLKN